MSQLLTFGGAYSNHIAATAAAGKEFGFKTIGVIRGDEVKALNPTLKLAQEKGMILKYIPRASYKEKYHIDFIKELESEFGDFYMIPEGGSNVEAVHGCSEILDNIDLDFDVVCCSYGTGGTLAGLIASLKNDRQILGFSALKGGASLNPDILNLLDEYAHQYNKKITHQNWHLIDDYHFGGYAKVDKELIHFIKQFKKTHQIVLDFIYTGKMMLVYTI